MADFVSAFLVPPSVEEPLEVLLLPDEESLELALPPDELALPPDELPPAELSPDELLPEDLLSAELSPDEPLAALREPPSARFLLLSFLKSVSYQPAPFNRKAAADTRRTRAGLPHAGQSTSLSSFMRCNFSICSPQASQRYS